MAGQDYDTGSSAAEGIHGKKRLSLSDIFGMSDKFADDSMTVNADNLQGNFDKDLAAEDWRYGRAMDTLTTGKDTSLSKADIFLNQLMKDNPNNGVMQFLQAITFYLKPEGAL